MSVSNVAQEKKERKRRRWLTLPAIAFVFSNFHHNRQRVYARDRRTRSATTRNNTHTPRSNTHHHAMQRKNTQYHAAQRKTHEHAIATCISTTRITQQYAGSRNAHAKTRINHPRNLQRKSTEKETKTA